MRYWCRVMATGGSCVVSERRSGRGALFEVRLQVDECTRERLRVLRDPPVGDLLDGNGVEEVELGAARTSGADEVRPLEHLEVLHHAEARHRREPVAQRLHRLA